MNVLIAKERSYLENKKRCESEILATLETSARSRSRHFARLSTWGPLPDWLLVDDVLEGHSAGNAWLSDPLNRY